MLVHAYITSRLDCGNALLHGVPESLLRQLQSVQNTAAGIVTRAGKQAHSKDLLEQLHWLPVSSGWITKPPPDLPCLAWSGASVPLSAADCLQTYQDPPLPLPATAPPAQEQTKDAWRPDFLFTHAAPRLSNALPSDLRAVNCLDDFKINLKTCLFKKASHRLHSET